MRVLKLAAFDKFAQKNDISDAALHDAVERAEKGQIAANLGSGVIKQRIAREGEGKRGGFRTIIIFRSMERAFFIYGFPKNKRDNIRRDEKEVFIKLAAHLLNIPDESVEALIEDGAYIEVEVNKNGETI